MTHEIIKLPYAFNALEPLMDAKTVEIHYTKHHQGYADKLNDALKNFPDLQDKSLEDLLKNLKDLPSEIAQTVKNMGGGIYNHNLYWEIMGNVKQTKPSEELNKAIISEFGSFENFKEALSAEALKRFASGWAWVSVTKEKKLTITSTPNHDTTLSEGMQPIMVIDVWEHAYYLNYQNRRADFISAWWNLINWEKVEEKYLEAIAKF